MKNIQEDIKSGQFRQAYLLYGEEAYLKQQYKHNLVKALNPDEDTMNFSRFEANLLLRRADPMRRAGMIEHQLFAPLRAEEIDSTLGYETRAVDARVAE